MFHMSVAVISLRTPFISELPPMPFEMMVKISPSLDPYSHLSSVRSDGLGLLGASGPSPLAVPPWQCRHAFMYPCRPFRMESAVGLTGFLSAAALGLPPLTACAPRPFVPSSSATIVRAVAAAHI